jgi:hypothetical protein
MSKGLELSTPEHKNEVLNYLEHRSYPDGWDKEKKRALRRKCESLSLINGSIFFTKSDGSQLRVVFGFQTEQIKIILREEHSNFHYGITKLSWIIKRKYYGIPFQAISDFVSSCEACTKFKSLKTLQDITMIEIKKKYGRYVIDCVDLRHYQEENDGYKWILNIVDSYTKFLWSYKLKSKSATEVARALENCFRLFGVPLAIQADNGKEFTNRQVRDLCTRMNIQVIHGRPRNPKAQGSVERVNQTVKRGLAKILFEKGNYRWIDCLEEIVYRYNCIVHNASNKSPFMLFFGKNGFNESQAIPEADESGNPAEPDVNSSSSYELWDFDEANNTSCSNSTLQDTDFHDETVTDNEVCSSLESNSKLSMEVAAHFEKYSQRTIRNANSNNNGRAFQFGDFSIIKKDFDNNTNTRRRPFESLYEDGTYKIVNFLNNNMIEIVNIEDPETTRKVHKNRLKKIKLPN